MNSEQTSAGNPVEHIVMQFSTNQRMTPIHCLFLGIVGCLLMCGCHQSQSETMFDYIQSIENHRASQSHQKSTDGPRNLQDDIGISDNEVLVVYSREHPIDISDDDIVMTTRGALTSRCRWMMLALIAISVFGNVLKTTIRRPAEESDGPAGKALAVTIVSLLTLSSVLWFVSVHPAGYWKWSVSCEVVPIARQDAGLTDRSLTRQDAGQLLHNA